MLNKIIPVIITFIFPRSHLELFLNSCSQIKFENRLTGRPQLKKRMFHPFYYKDQFVKDCILELKERNNKDVAKRFGEVLARWIVRTIREINNETSKQILNNTPVAGRLRRPAMFYLIPIPQHFSKTKEKGFCHTTTLTNSLHAFIRKKYPDIHTVHKPLIVKELQIKKLHTTKGKRKRFTMIQNSMKSYITKHDIQNAYFFIIDDVYTTGATFKEAHRSLLDCGVLSEHIFFISIAH